MRTKPLRVAILGLVCVAGLAAQQTPEHPPTAPPAVPFHEDLIAEITAGSALKGIVVSKNHVAWLEEQGGKYTLRLDGKQQGGTYQEVKFLNASPGGEHVAFFGRLNSKWALVMDGREGAQQYTKSTSVAFQPGGFSYAYGACVERKCHMFVDGSETGGEYEDISYPRYSSSGKKLAYLGKREKKWIAVIDGKEMGLELDDFWTFGFAHDGARFFVAGRRRNLFGYVVDGLPGPEFEVISPIAFSTDGRHYAYGGTVSKSGFKKQKVLGTVVLDGQSTLTYEGKGMTGSWSSLGGSQEVLQTGLRDFTPDFDGISNPDFSPEGKLVYAVRRDGGDIAVLVGADAGPGFEDILSPVIFTRDESHFVYVARRGSDFVEVRDNVPGRAFSAGQRNPTLVDWIELSADAAHVAYETVAGGRYFAAGTTRRAVRSIILDGREGPQYDALGLVDFSFDADATRYFYAVRGATGNKDLVNANGQESKLYDAVVGPHFVDDAKSVAFFALDGSRLLRVTYQFQAGAPAPKPPADNRASNYPHSFQRYHLTSASAN